MTKIKILSIIKTSNELSKIRAMMDIDPRKAKQQLTNLIQNINGDKGKCFIIMDVKD